MGFSCASGCHWLLIDFVKAFVIAICASFPSNDTHTVPPLSERSLQAPRTAIAVSSQLMGPVQAMSPWRGELAIDVYDDLLISPMTLPNS